MKKQLTAILMIMLLLLTMAGCTVAGAAQKIDAVEDKVERKMDAAEDKLEESLRNTVAPVPATEPAIPAPVQTVPATEPVQLPPSASEAPQQLNEEEALQIALDYLDFQADQISRQRIEFEIDDRIPQYDIEFHQGDWEYEFEIHAESGKILSYDKDHKYD